ncbi:MAG TPA: CPBP family intramembrane glutamic endopeptidase [Sphingomicrobium sp.]|nr:CPBP family intramembrane glutamic endopeptidase [Sphingomicrobium sp.]
MKEIEAAGQVPASAEQRPLWRRIANFPLMALFLALALFIAANALGALLFRALPAFDKPVEMVVKATVGIAILFAVYKLAIRRLGERPHDDLKLRDAPLGLGAGLLFGFLLFSLIVGVAALADVYNIVGGGGFAAFLPALIGMTIIPGFMEELLFRGILFRWIEELAGSWVALAVTSALFGLAHMFNPNASLLSSFAIAVEAGVLLGGLYMLTRSLWAPIGLHAAWNFTQGFIYDVPVSGHDSEGLVEAQLSGPELLSGGAFGLEASLIAMVLATAAGVVLVVLAIRKGELVRPWWVRRRLAQSAA